MSPALKGGRLMRDIKFRAWFKEWKIMLYDADGEHCNPSITLKGDLIGMQTNQNVEIMQFTGLHDKNGKEIYEGDIIKWVKKQYEVIFQEGQFTTTTHGDMMFPNWKACEIIGNIHETKD